MCLWKPESLWQGPHYYSCSSGEGCLARCKCHHIRCHSAKVHDICCVLTQGGISSGNSRAQGCGDFILAHEFLEGRDSIWEHSFSRIRFTVVLPRELNKQPLIIKKMMVYISGKKRGEGDCSWRGYQIVATLHQMWKSKENWYVKSVCFGLWVPRIGGNASTCGPSQARQRAWYT